MPSGSRCYIGSYQDALARSRTTRLEEGQCEYLGKDSDVYTKLCDLSVGNIGIL